MKTVRSSLMQFFVLLLTFFLGGCGDSGTDLPVASTTTTTTTTTTSGTSSTTTPGDPATVTVSATSGISSVISAAGSSTISATVVDSSSNNVADGTNVTFATDLAGTSITSSAVTTDGVASATFDAGTASGIATITVVAGSVTKTVSLQISSGVVGFIEFTSVSAASIGVRGAGKGETSDVSFTVKDSLGKAVGGAAVTFSAQGPPGVALSFSSATSSDTGAVLTTVKSGTVAGTVVVTASTTASGVTISSTSNGVTIQGGLPEGENFGLGPVTLNVPGLKILGVEDTITTRMADFFQNPVPDGTAVYFTSDFAGITGAAVTATADKNASATATLTSQHPLPHDGFVRVSAHTKTGERSRVLSLLAVSLTEVYAGTDGGGIFKTTDGGSSWVQVGRALNGISPNYFESLTNGVVRHIQNDLSNTHVLFAATDKGVFKSIGSGDYWSRITRNNEVVGELLGTGDGLDAIENTYDLDGNGDKTDDGDGLGDQKFNLAFNSTGQRAKTRVYINGTETKQYVFSSVNIIKLLGGAISAAFGNQVTIDYTIDAGFPEDAPIYAVAVIPTGSIIFSGSFGKGVYKTTNGGVTWSAVNAGLSNQNVQTLVAVDASTVYAGTYGGGVFKTTDGGANWIAVNSGLTASVIHKLAIDPNNTSKLYAGTELEGVFVTSNAGTTWTKATTNVNSADVTNTWVKDIVADSLDGTVYAATHGDGTAPLGGVYKSTDNGVTWARTTALTNNYVHALGVIGGAGNDTVFAGTQGRNIFKSDDSGTTWAASNGTSPSEISNDLYASSTVLYTGDTTLSITPYSDSAQGFGSFSKIFNGTSQVYLFEVADSNGNPLVASSAITVSASAGLLAGNVQEVLTDTQDGSTSFLVSLTNNVSSGTENVSADISFSITSDNGSLIGSLGRTLILPLSIIPGSASIKAGKTTSFTATGGSDTKYCLSVTGGTLTTASSSATCSKLISLGDLGTYAAPGTEGTETLTVQDVITGATATATITVAANPVVMSPETKTMKVDGTTKLTAGGGSGSFSWAVSGSGTLSTSTGASVTYTAPSIAGTETVTITDTVTNVTATATITVDFNTLAMSPTSKKVAQLGTNTFSASGGSGTYSWAVTSGSGTLTSTTGASVTYTAPGAGGTEILTVTDSVTSETATATITVFNTLVMSPTSKTVAQLGTNTFSASGGSGTYSWAVTSGSGTLTSTTGASVTYTAPGAGGTEILTVTDSLTSETATATITVP